MNSFRKYFEWTQINARNAVFKVDKLGIKTLKDNFPEMEIDDGIANHSGSHAKAESIVKDCLYGLRSLLDCASGPSHAWDHAALVYSYNVSKDLHNRNLGRYVGERFIFGETSHVRLSREDEGTHSY